MICKKCGSQIPDNSTICSYCKTPVYEEMHREQHSGVQNSEFISKNERTVYILKNGALSNFITGEGLKEEQAVLTNERLYYRHKVGLINQRKTMEIVDVKDITGTKISDINLLGILIGGIAFILIALVMFAIAGATGLIFLTWGIGMIIGYFCSLKKFFIIDYAGGNIKFSLRGYSMSDVENFQKQIHLCKSNQ